MTHDLYSEQYRKALDAAADWHSSQAKKGSGIAYISHLMTVSALVWDDHGDETQAIAALLHDAVEDGQASLDEVRSRFGSEVATIVENCSDSTPAPGEVKAPWFVRKVEHINNLRRVASKENSEPTMRVIAADKLSNVRSILVDHRGGAPDLWDRFKGGLGGSCWYYSKMADLVDRALPGSMLARELRLSVDTLMGLIAETTKELDGADSRIAAVLGDMAVADGLDATSFMAFELARMTSENPEDPKGAATKVLKKWLGPTESARADLGGLVDLIVG